MKRNKTWIFCGGMPRSGSTLQYQIVSELIERTGLGVRTTWYEPALHSCILSKHPEFGYSTFKTHVLTKTVKEICEKDEGITYYIYRDLRDVIASLKLKYNVNYDKTNLKKAVLELIDIDKEWRCLPKIYITSYEKLIDDFYNEIVKHAEFIGIGYNEKIFEEICVELSYDNQIRRIQNLNENDFVNNIFDKHSLLHKNHFFGGVVGRYKKELEKWQIFLIQDLAQEWLIDNNYELYPNSSKVQQLCYRKQTTVSDNMTISKQ